MPIYQLVIMSYPKSGRTWLRVMLDDVGIRAYAMHLGSGHQSGRPLQDISLELDNRYARKLALFRDPRDTVVSGYHQVTARLGIYRDTMSAFIRDPGHGIDRTIGFNLRLAELCAGRADCMMLTYEQMLADPPGVLERVAAFAGHAIERSTAIRVAADNNFELMQAREKAGEFQKRFKAALHAPKSPSPQALKVRRGVVGGYRDELSAEDIAYVDAAVAGADYERRITALMG